ncbi:DMT family transporter [Sinirhodobacter populi]|uniref:DMT family transporter n=1 Tax=Paenirhodobacter populi TaxID=2306993 RepID=A0A443KI89_9RHOB|nr:DMT family transporter [Sinirhodobacter populi]RWR32473.1 DMT family transporter [Sinirhodobacter populi]
MGQQDRILPGIALMLGFCIIAPLIDVAAKLASQAVPVGTVTLARYLVQGLVMAPFIWILRLPLLPQSGTLRLSLARAFFSVLATYCFIAAVQVMPIADALAIAFVEPFVILFIGRFVLNEEVGGRRLAAAVVGFIGALFVIQPSFSRFGAVALFPLGTAVCFAGYILLTRSLSRRMHPVAMQFQTALLGAALCLPLLLIGTAAGIADISLAAPQGIFWIWCLCVGLASTVSHMLMTYALKFAPSTLLAPIHYFEMIAATLFGYLVFGDFPNRLTWIGIAIITGSGLYVIHRERIKAAQARRAACPDTVSAQG